MRASNQDYIDGCNRLNCYLNGVPWTPTVQIPEMPIQPPQRSVKPLSEILDLEHASASTPKAAQDHFESNRQIIARLLTPTESVDDVPTGEAPQVMLSAAEAAGRKVKTLQEIMNDEACGLIDATQPKVHLSAAANFRFSGRVLRLE